MSFLFMELSFALIYEHEDFSSFNDFSAISSFLSFHLNIYLQVHVYVIFLLENL